MYCPVCVKTCKILKEINAGLQPEKDDSCMVPVCHPEDEDLCKILMCAAREG
jgi:hypothetical protein